MENIQGIFISIGFIVGLTWAYKIIRYGLSEIIIYGILFGILGSCFGDILFHSIFKIPY